MSMICYRVADYLFHVYSVQIGPFQSKGGKAKLKVKVRLNLHGIVSIESATVSADFRNYGLHVYPCLFIFSCICKCKI